NEDYRSRTWKNKSKLIDTWVSEFPKLKAKHHLGTRYSQNLNWWESVDLGKFDGVLGGELAAFDQLSDQSAAPREGVIYIDKYRYREFVRELRLILPEHVGNNEFSKIEIRSKYWGKTEDLKPFADTTHPFITYADLMDTWDPINIELAKQLADKYF
nr:type IV toxin-antitoxin system AbiEi family antitoxin [Acidiferrobacterales bacterium]